MRIVKIGAVWCPGCLVMRPVWKSIENEIPCEVVEYDYDMDEDEIEKYNVGDKLPVVILEEDGKEIRRIVGEKTKEELLDFIRGSEK